MPSHAVSQGEAAEIGKSLCCSTPEHERLLPALYRRTRVATRYSVLVGPSNGSPRRRQTFYPAAEGNGDRGPTTSARMDRYEREAATLAESAAHKALTRAGTNAGEITHLVTVSCTGFHAPGLDLSLIKRLGLSRGIGRTHVGFMGCHGALNGLRVAKAFTDADPRARVLLCAVELCSLHYQYGWNRDRIVANALFADGAAALVGTGEAAEAGPRWELQGSASTIFGDSEEAMTWRIGDHGFEMTLSPQVPELIAEGLRPWLARWLGEQGLTIEAVGSWAVHPGGPRVLSAFLAAAELDGSAAEASRQILAEYGNMSSPTTLFILERLQEIGAPRPCVALAFGPGLAVEAALLR